MRDEHHLSEKIELIKSFTTSAKNALEFQIGIENNVNGLVMALVHANGCGNGPVGKKQGLFRPIQGSTWILLALKYSHRL